MRLNTATPGRQDGTGEADGRRRLALLVMPPGGESDHLDILGHPLAQHRPWHAAELAVEAQVLLGRYVRVQRGFLKDQPDFAVTLRITMPEAKLDRSK